MNFTKLDAGIVDSTLWMQPHDVLRVWIALLAKCDARGYVRVSVPSLAHLCMVTVERLEQILQVLSAPDPYSRTKEDDGRRLREVAGGFEIINYLAYRNARDDDADRERKREWDRKHRPSGAARQSDAVRRSPTQSDESDKFRQSPTQEEAEEEAETTTTEARPTHHATNARDAARGVEAELDPAPTAPDPEPPKPHGMAVATAIALRKRGARCNATHPDLVAAEAEGVTVGEVLAMADAYPDKPFGYVIAAARRQHAEIPREVVAAHPRAGPAPPLSKTATAFAALERIATGHPPHADALDTTATVVHLADRSRLAAPAGAEP